jgi:hypothetical protein
MSPSVGFLVVSVFRAANRLPVVPRQVARLPGPRSPGRRRAADGTGNLALLATIIAAFAANFQNFA